MKIGIVVPVLNNFRGFTDFVSSIKTQYDYQIYVQPQYRAQVPLARAWNQGARQAFADGCKFALICNDDIMFAPECIDNMVEEMWSMHNKKVVMVTPNNILGEVGDPYNILNYTLPKGHQATMSEHPNFSCFMVGKEYFNVVGYFDENFNPAWYEDNDSHRRAELAGVREITTTAAPMVHIGGVSSHMWADNPGSGASQAYYIEKWGGIPVSHPLDVQKEHFDSPYNDSSLTLKDWRGNEYER